VGKPQVIEDEEHGRVFERVAAVDVAKASGMVCTRRPPPRPGGRRASTVQEVPASMTAIRQLGARLVRERIEMVTLESTSDYWRIWYYVLEEAGLVVQLVNASQARNLPGRPKTDRLDAMWLARLTEMGLLRPSFVPPAPVRALRDYTRARTHLTQDRTRCWQRLEKLLEGALIKVSSVASKLTTLSAQDMVRALINGERDPVVLAGLARTRMRAKHDALVEALTGMFDDHHGELARMLLDQIGFCTDRIGALDAKIAAAAGQLPAAWGITAEGVTGPGAGTGPAAQVLPAVQRLAEIPGISEDLARSIIAETGLDMTRFPTAAHLVSWAGLAPVARQSGPRNRKPKKGQGDAYLKGHCTQAAAGAAKTDTFLGERLRRLSRKLGGTRARCAVGRSILVIIWHLLANPEARFADLGPDWHTRKTDRDRKTRTHLRGLQDLGYTVTITPAA